MRPPIGQHRIAQVQRMLRAGMSQRQISKAAGLSHTIVNEIAQGKRGVEQFSEDGPLDFQTVNPYKCPGCERTVNTAPCVACAGRRRA